jgi:hypothetical protein
MEKKGPCAVHFGAAKKFRSKSLHRRNVRKNYPPHLQFFAAFNREPRIPAI